MTTIRELSFALRKMGFRRAWRDRDVVQYELNTDGITVEVQLWFDGGHRACHRINGRSDTYPSYFHTEHGMLRAVEFEKTRRARSVPRTTCRHFS